MLKQNSKIEFFTTGGEFTCISWHRGVYFIASTTKNNLQQNQTLVNYLISVFNLFYGDYFYNQLLSNPGYSMQNQYFQPPFLEYFIKFFYNMISLNLN